MISGQLARSQIYALRGVARCVLMRRPAERWTWWAAGDYFKKTI